MPDLGIATTSKTAWLHRPLAIVGMACRLPGADDLEAFWNLLSSGGCAIERMSNAKLDRSLYYDPEISVRGKTYSDVGGFVSQREPDWSVLPISPDQAQNWDECHLNLCEVAAKACIHAGYDPRQMPIRKASVFVGHSGGSTLGGELAYRTLSQDYVELLEQLPEWAAVAPEQRRRELRDQLLSELQRERPRRESGRPNVDASYAAGLISQALGLQGPSLSIDAACASSLVALALGANSLHSGQADMAIIGGASYNKTDSLILFSQARSCSAATSRPFDEAADGLISSEGYVSIVVKTLDRAEADGDRIHAVVRGIGVASDGRGRSLWAPRKEGQCEAIRRAYSDEIRPASVQMIEAHATSTQVGDATEMEALATFYGQHLPPGETLPVGSVKSNIGHTLETAGLAGLVKSVLAIQHQTIPPTVNLQSPSTSIPWATIPIRPALQAEPWPNLPPGEPRRAAVNAFGIGGLNVHVVVDQYISQAKNFTPHGSGSVATTTAADDAIVVVGRGLVVPGASDVVAFAKLLASPASQLKPSPWRPEMLCGRVEDFQYDWRKHKVPPKQIAQANPLQFMLLEAAEQALRESGALGNAAFDRQRTAVVVGSPFGGDFGNALFAGLRLPEFRMRLLSLLSDQGFSHAAAEGLADAYESHFLKTYPALLDETGSFTSSTLASRLSKTFDLMGGAMAIDSGDCSSLGALSVAAGLLRSHAVDHVLCAAAHTALDRAALENLEQLRRVKVDRQIASDGYEVGEGVALLMLKRRADAIQAGDKIWATIGRIGSGFDARSLPNSLLQAIQACGAGNAPRTPVWGAVGIADLDAQVSSGLSLNAGEFMLSPSIASTGYLQATQALADVISVSCQPLGKHAWIASHSPSGQSCVVQVFAGDTVPTESTKRCAPVEQASQAAPQTEKTAALSSEEIFHFSAESEADFETRLRTGLADKPDRASDVPPGSMPWQAAIVCAAEELASKASSLAGQFRNPRAASPLGEQGVFWKTSATTGAASSSGSLAAGKVAWLFPGQGSQYSGMLRELVASDAAAAVALEQANRTLAEAGQPAFAQLAWHADNALGENVFQTQAAMLVADWILYCTLRSRGLSPDLVAGHSYGEIPAMLAAGCWDLSSALAATWQRCQAITEHVPAGCGMLSIQASEEQVREVVTKERFDISISHLNAPQQTVVGGKRSVVAQLAQVLEEANIASRMLPVPTAFHTPFLAAAKVPFLSALKNIAIEPPKVPLLSCISNQYVADPQQMRASLSNQLVDRLDFVGLVQRMVQDGVRVVVEVGPQSVLSRLIRQTTDQIVTVSTDHPKRDPQSQLLRVQAVLGLYAKSKPASKDTFEPSRLAASSDSGLAATVHFDATQRRKARIRHTGQTPSISQLGYSTGNPARAGMPVVPVTEYDASERRRMAKRVQAEAATTQRADDGRVDVVDVGLVAAQVIAQDESPTASSSESIERFLIDFVVEQTGYPAEIIELDWDIEADLGIDSIKKAQLFGELREFFELEVHAQFSLDAFRTLRDIVELLMRTPGKGEWLNTGTGVVVQDVAQEVAQEVAQQTVTNSNSGPTSGSPEPAAFVTEPKSVASVNDEATLTQILVDFVVEQTGYPPEIVDLDADLEADLGIDSIKQTQLLGELREMFDLNVADISAKKAGSPETSTAPRTAMPQLRTLRAILELLLEQQVLSQDSNVEQFVGDTAPVTPTFETPSGAIPPASVEVAIALPRLPIDGAVDVEGFRRSLQECITRLVSRSGCGDELHSLASARDSIGQRRVDALATRLANAGNVHEDSVRAFNAAVAAEANWYLTRAAQRGVSLASDGSAQSVSWLAQMELPKWLQHTDASPLVIFEHEGRAEDSTPTCDTVGLAGELMPTCALHDSRFLLVAGTDANAETRADMKRELSSFVQQPPRSLEAVEKLTRQLRLPANWWIVAVDAATGTQLLVESEHETLVIERRSVDVSSDSVEPDANVVRVGLDGNSCAIVIQLGKSVSSIAENYFPKPSDANPKTLGVPSGPEMPAGELKTVASRYVLRMTPAPLRSSSGRQPTWAGAALVVGDNAIARQLEARLRSAGVTVCCLAGNRDPLFLADEFRKLAEQHTIAHLFITTPWDDAASFSLVEEEWSARRNEGLLGNFWLCQAWLEHVVERECASESSLVAVTSLGGDFGIQQQPRSVEGGGLAGLMKSMMIESWTRGIRPLPIKILDCDEQQSPAEIVGNVWQELANPSYDFEVAYRDGIREVVRAIPRPIHSRSKPLPRNATWVCTGGARGITAYVAEQLGRRYGLKLHLLGTAPVPAIPAEFQTLDDAGLRRLKSKVMTEARDAGKSPIKAWQDTEKALEIDRTLRKFAELGIEAHYHCCNVSDREALNKALHEVRRISGPITGVLHGAGVGKDSRFDRKQAEKVDQCIAAKVDGALALMSATADDPLEYFVGFGSISGRFGANGHTDYSLANEMLCKQIDWLARTRPEVRAVGFHWHAWGDVGMATKPETQLALEMIDMQFMPAAEGIEHLIAELESGEAESEILITDDRYYRMFFPAETLVNRGSMPSPSSTATQIGCPLLERSVAAKRGGAQAWSLRVDPNRDPFLSEHLLDGKPLLPFVVASEILAQAARRGLQTSQVVLRDVEAHSGLRFFGDAEQELRVEVSAAQSEHVVCQLFSDFSTRDGRLVEANRKNFSATALVATGAMPSLETRAVRIKTPAGVTWQSVRYPAIDAKFFVGPSLQRLRKVALVERGLVGRIVAPALGELAGSTRDVRGWQIPSAAMDACLFATGILAWQQVAAGAALPVRIAELRHGRLPDPGEACEVHVRLKSASDGKAEFDFTLFGVDGAILLTAVDYQVAWLAAEASEPVGFGTNQSRQRSGERE